MIVVAVLVGSIFAVAARACDSLSYSTFNRHGNRAQVSIHNNLWWSRLEVTIIDAYHEQIRLSVQGGGTGLTDPIALPASAFAEGEGRCWTATIQ